MNATPSFHRPAPQSRCLGLSNHELNSKDTDHRRHGVRRRTTDSSTPGPWRRVSTSSHGAQAGIPSSESRLRCRDRRRRCHQTGDSWSSSGRDRHRLLPHPFDGQRAGFRRAGSTCREEFCRGSEGQRRQTHCLSRRIGRSGRVSLETFAKPSRSWCRAARIWCPGH